MEEIVKSDNIGNLIYEIRGKQVMLDSDLGRLYECANGTKTINQAVKRHIDRFPEDFCFQLTEEEYENLRSQLGTANTMSRTRPYVFAEQGVAMLATVLKTRVAAQMSIAIMRAFVAMRRYISSSLLEQKRVNELVYEDHDRINLIEDSLKKFEQKQVTNTIFFNGQIYDAYFKICEIFKEAKENLIIIDNYADNVTLNIIKTLKVPVTIIASSKAPLSKQDIKKYNSQYDSLKVVRNDTFHDRYFILGNKIAYHCGASINYIGKRTFSITKISDENVVDLLNQKVAKITCIFP